MNDLQRELVQMITTIMAFITMLMGALREWKKRDSTQIPIPKDANAMTEVDSKNSKRVTVSWRLWVPLVFCVGVLVSEALSNDPVSGYDVIRISFLVTISTIGLMVIAVTRRG